MNFSEGSQCSENGVKQSESVFSDKHTIAGWRSPFVQPSPATERGRQLRWEGGDNGQIDPFTVIQIWVNWSIWMGVSLGQITTWLSSGQDHARQYGLGPTDKLCDLHGVADPKK